MLAGGNGDTGGTGQWGPASLCGRIVRRFGDDEVTPPPYACQSLADGGSLSAYRYGFG